jgi:hypothetical protein
MEGTRKKKMKLVDGLIIYEKGDKIIVNANAEKFSHTPVAGAQGVGWMKQMDEMLEKQYTLERSGNNGEFEIGRFTFNSYMVRPFYDVPSNAKDCSWEWEI